jgi:hypothetical protein
MSGEGSKQRLDHHDLSDARNAARRGSTSHYETVAKLGWSRQRLSRLLIKFDAVDEFQAIYSQNKMARRGGYEPTHEEPSEMYLPTGASPTVSAPVAPEPEIVGATSDVKPDIDRIIKSTEAFFDVKAQRARQKMHQSVRFPFGPVALFFVGDQHIGNMGTDVRRMLDEQKMIMETPGSYVVQMGDIVDNFVVGRLIAENWKESAPVWDQWHLGKHYLEGFKDRLIAVNGGNHDFWHHKVSGIDYTREITPPGVLYDADTLRFRVHVGPAEFKVWTRHKWRGKSMYNPTHGQERGAREDDGRQDIYVGAHNHTGAVCREFVREASRKIAIQIGTYKIHDDYATSEGFPRHDASTCCALILHDSGAFHAMSDLQAALEFMRAVYKGG